MLKKALLEKIIPGLLQGVVRGWKRKVERNNSSCKKVIILDMIPMKDLHKGNKPCLISLSDLIAVIERESWRIYESKLRTWRLSWEANAVEGTRRTHLKTPITLRQSLLEVAIHDGWGTDLAKPWGIIMNPLIVIGTGIIMPRWMPWAGVEESYPFTLFRRNWMHKNAGVVHLPPVYRLWWKNWFDGAYNSPIWWNMLVTIFKWCCSIPRMMVWCARCSHPSSGWRQWGG